MSRRIDRGSDAGKGSGAAHRTRATGDDALFPDLDPLMHGTSTPLFNARHWRRIDLPHELASGLNAQQRNGRHSLT
jgi:hypothetical protein